MNLKRLMPSRTATAVFAFLLGSAVIAVAVGHYGTILPKSDNAYDLGATANEWRDVYVDGEMKADTVTVDARLNISGSILPGTIASGLTPTTDDQFDLGSSSAQWKNIYIDGSAYLDNIAEIGTVTQGLTPTTDDQVDLGSSSAQWRNAYIDGTIWTDAIYADAVSAGLTPSTDDQFDLGSAAAQFKDLYVDGTANIDLASIDEFSEALVSDTDNQDDLGTSTTEWKDGFFDGTLYADRLRVDESISAGLTPTTDNQFDLGSTTAEWRNGYIDGTLYTDAIYADAVANGLTPSTDGVYDLGSASAEYKDLYIDGYTEIDSLNADNATLLHTLAFAITDIGVGSGSIETNTDRAYITLERGIRVLRADIHGSKGTSSGTIAASLVSGANAIVSAELTPISYRPHGYSTTDVQFASAAVCTLRTLNPAGGGGGNITFVIQYQDD